MLAHQGGWDEILMVAAPVALLFIMLVVANRRAKQVQEERDSPSDTERADTEEAPS